ncbi:hypothetical protein KIN20_031762 [Parelaphostrongylus tenuis]|uniref:Uncharacterized protein n=1 Tax=Parelaphostrongylus tenuis TaxID=148309 RepID=A0AAD5R7C5_PARTN|nr:hypothetical protein KIN20_031762 [Parelaphostrongylus tenuis]
MRLMMTTYRPRLVTGAQMLPKMICPESVDDDIGKLVSGFSWGIKKAMLWRSCVVNKGSFRYWFVRYPCEMDVREFIVCFVVLCSTLAEAIRCKCTKESETVSCVDGVCEIESGSCLMLDHPTLGVHYTCHNKLQKDGFCREKTSKSGALVKICGCNSDDFCNYSYWPDKSTPAPPLSQLKQDDERISEQNGNSNISLLSVVFIMLLMSFRL